MKKSASRRLWGIIAIVTVAAMLVGACEPAAPVEPMVETVVVTQVVEVERTIEVERTVEVEITPEAQPGEMEGPTLNPEVSGSVELWHFWASPVRRNAIRRVIAICQEKLPNIQVTDTVKPFGDIWTANLAAVAAGSGMPDVIVSDRPKLPQDAVDGVYMNLQEWADRDGINPADFYPFTWDQSLHEGNTYGIPFETDVRVLFYNKNLFAQADLDPERPPQTWDELWEYADALDRINPDGSIERMGFFPLFGNASPEVWGYTNGVEWITADQQPMINSPKAVETVEWVQSWIERYGGWQNVQDFRAQFGAPPNDIFMSSGVAMIADIAGYTSILQFYRPFVTLDDGSEVRMEWGVGLLPYNESPGSWSGGFAFSIPTGARNAEAAWEFIKCATGEEGQASWARDTYAQPAHVGAANDPVLMADPHWQFFIEAMDVSTGGVYLVDYPNWGGELGQRYEQIWTGELTAQEALDQAQEAVEAQIR